jgi:hypothetical protein
MAENMEKWPSGYGQLTKIRLSEGAGGTTITPAAQFGYDCHGFEGYLGNVGQRQRTASDETARLFECEYSVS